MDYVYYGAIALAVILVIFIFVKLINKNKKEDGNIDYDLGKTNEDKNYYVLDEITFHDGIRNATIHQLIINQSGVHAVCEFPYEGEITGRQDLDEWTFNHKGVEDTFKNPMIVTSNIVLSIDKVLKKNLPIYAYAVFPEKAELPRNRKQMDLLFADELKDAVTKKMKSKKKISVTDVKNTYELFNNVKITRS